MKSEHDRAERAGMCLESPSVLASRLCHCLQSLPPILNLLLTHSRPCPSTIHAVGYATVIVSDWCKVTATDPGCGMEKACALRSEM